MVLPAHVPRRCGGSITAAEAQRRAQLIKAFKKPKPTVPRVEKAVSRMHLRVRSQKVVPKSYNEGYLADATAGRTPTVPAKATTKKAKIAKPALKKGTAASRKGKNPKPTKEARTETSILHDMEEREKKEAKENMKLAAKSFAAGKPTYYIFGMGGCSARRNHEIGRLYQELVAKAEAGALRKK